MLGFELMVMGVMIALNSVFAAYELALASVSFGRLKILQSEKKGGSQAAFYMKENMEGSLAGIQLGITLVGAIAAATGGAGAHEDIAPHYQQWFGVSKKAAEILAVTTVVIPLTIFTIIFGELIPKVFALRNKEWVCLKLSPGMKFFVTLVHPIVWVLETSVTMLMSLGSRLLKGRVKMIEQPEVAEIQELRASASLARTSRHIGPQEERIILEATELSRRPVTESMLPAIEISMLNVNDTIADALVAAHLDMHTRFPITETPDDPQSIVGYVNFKDIIAQMRLSPNDPSLRSVTRSIPSFSAELSVSACLERLIRERIHIALIRDQANQIVGMVTLEDLIEELLGDIEDEFDRLPIHVNASGRGWVVGGGVGPAKLREMTGIEMPTAEGAEPVKSLSDWVEARVQGPLDGGETVEQDGLRVVVRKVRRHRVWEAQVEKVPQTAETKGP